MDNLTHSLAGALLGRAGLKRLTGRVMPALIVSANLPDIDRLVARIVGWDPDEFHRGFTHGIGGMVLLPPLTAALVLGWERWRPGKDPARFWPLVLVSFLGWLSHVLLDLMSSYGVRLLEPFSHQRFYAGSVFMIDPWISAMLLLGLLLSWRSERFGGDWRKPALASCAALFAYGCGNYAVSEHARTLATRALKSRQIEPSLVLAQPRFFAFWSRRILWRTDEVHGDGSFSLFRGVGLSPRVVPNRLGDPRLASAIRTSRHVRAFLFRSRMPIVVERKGRAYLSDQSYPDLKHPTIFVLPLDS